MEARSGIYHYSDRRRLRHRHYQNLTASADRDSNCWILALQVLHTELEALRHIVVDRLIEKTSRLESDRRTIDSATKESSTASGDCQDVGTRVHALNLSLVVVEESKSFLHMGGKAHQGFRPNQLLAHPRCQLYARARATSIGDTACLEMVAAMLLSPAG